MGFEIDIDISAQGPVFDGRWEGILSTYKEVVLNHLSDESVHRIKVYLPTQYMYLGHSGGDPKDNPIPPDAGYLVSTIHQRRETADSHLVLDGGYPQVIYGPWIEGIAPGNTYFGAKGRAKRGLSPRFPGYHAFQKTAHEVQAVAADLAYEDLPPFLAALNDELHLDPADRVPEHVRPGRVLGVAGPGGERGPRPRGGALGHAAGCSKDSRCFGEHRRHPLVPQLLARGTYGDRDIRCRLLGQLHRRPAWRMAGR